MVSWASQEVSQLRASLYAAQQETEDVERRERASEVARLALEDRLVAAEYQIASSLEPNEQYEAMLHEERRRTSQLEVSVRQVSLWVSVS